MGAVNKSRKRRGHVSAGYGRVGKHRKHSGGRGNAGGLHHRRSWYTRYHPEHFGKVGQRRFWQNRTTSYCPTINIDCLVSAAGIDPNAAYPDAKGRVPVIDVSKLGYFKVLGKGRLPANLPLIVKAKLFSKNAVLGIKKSGGTALLTA